MTPADDALYETIVFLDYFRIFPIRGS